jgi:phosphoserine aminotransferase
MSRISNFKAAPCTLPLSALEDASAEIVEFGGNGTSIIKMSHSLAGYQAVHARCLQLAAELFGVPSDCETLVT